METLPAKCKLDTFIKWNDKYINKNGFTLLLGKAYDIVAFDLEIDNHLLIGGCTNIGKSVIICCLVYQCILKKAKIFLLDFKFGVEFNKEFEQFGEVVTKRKRALEILQELTKECEKRGNLLREYGVKKLSKYNELENVKKLSRIVIFCDELAELLDTTAKDNYEKKLCNEIISEFSTIARTGRALGIHLIGAMQKVDAAILTGQIKSNMERITGALKDSYAIKQFLGVDYKVDNFIPGRFLYKPENEIVSFQAFYFDSDELKKIKNYEPDGIVLVEQEEKPKLELVKSDDPVDEEVEIGDKSNKLQGFK